MLIPFRGRRTRTIDEILAKVESQQKSGEAGAGGSPPNPDGNPNLGAQSDPIVIPAGASLLKSGNNYVFTQIPYQNKILDLVELSGALLDNGSSKTQVDWIEYSRTNPEKWSAVDSEMIYQLFLRAYQLRNEAKHQPVVSEFTAFMQGLLDSSKPYLMTLTKFNYISQSLDAVVSKHGTFPGNVADKRIQIPEFKKSDNDWSYLVLSDERLENQLETLKSIPNNANPIMETLLGKDYEHAGAVFSYFSSRNAGKLRESRLWTPTVGNRNIGKRRVAFGVYRWFILNTNDDISYTMPALGVRSRRAQNFVGGS
jgi:hypothetical protein